MASKGLEDRFEPPSTSKVNWVKVAEEIGCSHAYYLSWAKKCEGCRKTPLSPRLAYLEETYNREG